MNILCSHDMDTTNHPIDGSSPLSCLPLNSPATLFTIPARAVPSFPVLLGISRMATAVVPVVMFIKTPLSSEE